MSTQALVRALYRVRWLLLALLVPLVLASAVLAAGVGTDNAVHVWFVEGDPALESYDAFQERFGNDEVVVLAVTHSDGVLAGEGRALLEAITRAAQQTQGIASVQSLANLSHARIADDWQGSELEAPPIEVEPVLDDSPEEVLKRRVLEDPLLRDRLVSQDGRTALVLSWMQTNEDMDAVRDGILADLDARVTEAAGQHVPMAGVGVIFWALNQASSRDVALLGGASYLVILLLLWFLLGRRLGPVLLSLGAIGAAAALAMGLMGATGRDMNMVTMALPTLVLIIAVADMVHFLHALGRESGDDPHERVISGVSRVLWPCLFTSLTTSAGFLALASARMPVVRDLGLLASAGVMIAFVVALVLVLALGRYAWLHPELPDDASLRRSLAHLGEWAMRHRGAVLSAALVASLLGAWGTSRIVPDTYSIDYFRQAHWIKQDNDHIQRHFGPYTPLEFVVRTPNGRSSEVLSGIAAWQDAMEDDPDVGWTRSPADVSRRMNQLLTDGAASSFAVPPTDQALEEALWLWESDPDADLSDQVDEDWTELRVTAGLRMMSANDIGAALDRLVDMAQLPDDCEIVPSGYLPLYVTMMDYVVRSQITSFALAFLIIFALLALLYRSLRVSLLALPANLFPLFLTMGLMGLVGIRLDVATVTIAALVLGLVVDDTTHLLYRYREALRAGSDHEDAVRHALDTAGAAMATTSVVLVLGFSVLALATVKSVAYFGLLAAAAMGFAVVGDLVVLPALLVTLRPKL